jgi:hypothetical protein
MNERIKELAEQAGLDAKEIRDDESLTLYAFENFDLERFAELIRQGEREACAKLCDEEADQSSSDHEAFGMYCCAEAIRQRGKK